MQNFKFIRKRAAVLGILFCVVAWPPEPKTASDLPVVVARVDDCNASWLNPLAALGNKSPRSG